MPTKMSNHGSSMLNTDYKFRVRKGCTIDPHKLSVD